MKRLTTNQENKAQETKTKAKAKVVALISSALLLSSLVTACKDVDKIKALDSSTKTKTEAKTKTDAYDYKGDQYETAGKMRKERTKMAIEVSEEKQRKLDLPGEVTDIDMMIADDPSVILPELQLTKEEAFRNMKESEQYKAMKPDHKEFVYKAIGENIYEKEYQDFGGVGVDLKYSMFDQNKPTILIGTFSYCGHCHNAMEYYQNNPKEIEKINEKYNLVFIDYTDQDREQLIQFKDEKLKGKPIFPLYLGFGDDKKGFRQPFAPLAYYANSEGMVMGISHMGSTDELLENADRFIYGYDKSVVNKTDEQLKEEALNENPETQAKQTKTTKQAKVKTVALMSSVLLLSSIVTVL